MGDESFDIYQTNAGYTAVHNRVQRDILEALAKEELQLPQLVELTGRGKPTLSGNHIKELVARELIEERPHPEDKRRKIYSLVAQKIGSSDLPVPDLRDAVRRYVTLAPVPGHLQVTLALSAISRAPSDARAEVLWQQASNLGAALGPMRFDDLRDAWLRFARHLEGLQVARMVSIDLDATEMVVAPLIEGQPEARAAVIAGFVYGALNAAGQDLGHLKGDLLAGDQVRLAVAKDK